MQLARKGSVAFVYREVLADTDTPVSAYAKLGRGPYSFLLESVVGGDKWAAYSFVGVRARAVVRARGEVVELLVPDGAGFRVAERVTVRDPIGYLDDYLAKQSPAVPPGLPRFFGGAVGWLGYDIVRTFERMPSTQARRARAPRALLRHHRHVVVFDNLRGTVKVVAAADVGERRSGRGLRRRLRPHRAVLDKLARPPAPPLRPLGSDAARAGPAATPRTPRETYEAGVRRVKEYILAGDIFQVVLSQRFEVPRGASTRSTSTARCA